jgi:hypothetical protein
MGYDGIWTYLSKREIVNKLSSVGIEVSSFVVFEMLKELKLTKKKLSKCETIKEVEFRNEQFENIKSLISKYASKNNPVISIDTKKKENLGNLYRDGKVYCNSEIGCYDHDYPSLASGVVYPHGIFDIMRNEGYINLVKTKDTAELSCEHIELWWTNYGCKNYQDSDELLILCDGGGSNSSSSYLFKENLQKLSNKINLKIRIAHYPPYCSKYNPIEHKMFPHITRSLQGIILKNAETIKELIEERAVTAKGFKAIVHISNKVYETGKKASTEFINNMKIKFDKNLTKWNYLVSPQKMKLQEVI